MSANKAAIMAVLGASGSGKSTFIKREIRKPAVKRRLLIWDPMREYGAHGRTVTTAGELVEAIGAEKFAIVFQPSGDPKLRVRQFDLVCRAALAAGRLTLVVEELRFVTTPSRAPLGWAQVCLTGRHAGLTVYGASQRPASIDKDFLGNCTRIRTGRLAYPADEKAVAAAARVDVSEIPTAPLEFLEIDLTTGAKTLGKLKF